MHTSYSIEMNLRRNVIFLEDFTFAVILMQRMTLVSSQIPLFNDKAPPAIAACHVNVTNNVVTAYCGKLVQYFSARYHVPHDLRSDVQVLDLTPDDSVVETTFDIKPDQLQHFAHLHTILLKRNYIMHWGVKALNQRIQVNSAAFDNVFKNLEALETLEFVDSCLNDNWQLTLPKSIKKLVLDQNQYHLLDVRHSPEIEEISLNNNNQQNLPLLHDPFPPLKTLRLMNNPLENMTLLDIAPLCYLEVLELQFPPNTRYAKTNSMKEYCECDALITWIKNQSIAGVENINCVKPHGVEENDCLKHTSEILTQADSERENCLKAKEILDHKAAIDKFMLYLVYGIAVVMLIAFACAFLIWHKFHWAIDETIPSSTNAAAEEDEEEDEDA